MAATDGVSPNEWRAIFRWGQQPTDSETACVALAAVAQQEVSIAAFTSYGCLLGRFCQSAGEVVMLNGFAS